MLQVAFLILNAVTVSSAYVKVSPKENEIAKSTLPGMIFVPLFFLAVCLFVIGRTVALMIVDRRRRPLNSAEVISQMTNI